MKIGVSVMRRLLALVVLSLAELSCMTYGGTVNGYTDLARRADLQSGSRVLVVTNPEANNSLLEAEVSAKIGRLLLAHGYRVATDTDAEFMLAFGYGIGSGRGIRTAIPVYDPGRTGTVQTVGPSGTSLSTIQIQPQWSTVSVSRTEFDRWLVISLIDAEEFRRTGKIRQVWVGEVASTGSNSNLREVIDYLLVAAFESFGENTPKARRFEIVEGDSKVRALNQ